MEKIISIDFQNDFTSEGGICYKPRKSVHFFKNHIAPYFKKNNIQVIEIISDYRQPRKGDQGNCCHPGEWGYQSKIPKRIRSREPWIKSMNSPIWIRDNIGIEKKVPGEPYQDPEKFAVWLKKNIGSPEKNKITLMGLTLDCCVLSAAQELTWRGYEVSILREGTDTYSGDLVEKEYLLKNPPLTNWAKGISWDELKRRLKTNL